MSRKYREVIGFLIRQGKKKTKSCTIKYNNTVFRLETYQEIVEFAEKLIKDFESDITFGYIEILKEK